MKKSWIFTGLITVMILTIGGLFFWKNYYRTPLKSNTTDIKATLLTKAEALFDDKESEFLAKNLEEKDIGAVSDELNRILVAQKISKDNAIPTSETDLVTSQEKIELASQKLAVQLRLNGLFQPTDFRQTDGEPISEKVDVDQVFDTESSSTSTSSDSSATDTSQSRTRLKDIAAKANQPNELMAINGPDHNAFLIISDTLVMPDLETTKKALASETEKGPWYQAMAVILKNAEDQLTVYDAAKAQVEGLFEGTEVRYDITKEEFKEVLAQVEKIHSQKRQETLMEQMEKVAEAIGEELLNRDFVFENLSTKEGVTFSASQTNADWWSGPIAFSVTIKNETNKNISFSYGRLAILKETNTFHPSQYELRSDKERFVVKKGESFTIDSLQFKFPTEALVNSSRGSQLAYILDKEEVSTPTTIIIANVLLNEKQTTTSSSEEPETPMPSLDVAAIQKVREELLALNVTANSLTDVDMQALIDQGKKDKLDDKGLIKLICEYLGYDYEQVMAEANTTNSAAKE